MIDYKYDKINSQQIINIEQIQDQSNTTTYRLPFAIDIYVNETAKRFQVEMTQEKTKICF